jgi:hypothetical protein
LSGIVLANIGTQIRHFKFIVQFFINIFRGVIMKRLLIAVFVVIGFMLMSGCSEKSESIVSPAESVGPAASVQHESVAKAEASEPMGSIFSGKTIKNLITLIPLPAPMWKNDPGSSSTALITSRYGGRVRVNYSYSSVFGKRVSVSATFTVPPGSIDKDTYVTMSLDSKYIGLKFKPGGLKFKVPAELDFSASGLDLSALPFGKSVSLYYVDLLTSAFEKVKASGVSAGKFQGTIVCNNAQINHFSRYAFGY